MKENNKLLVYNTIILNAKTVIVLILSFLTSRFVLSALSVDGYGLYYLIAGVTATFEFLCSSLLSTTTRFTTLAEGKHNTSYSNVVFNTLRKSNQKIIIWILVILETAGMAMLLFVLNIPSGLKLTAIIVYQLMVIDTYFKMIVMPYNSILMAKENFLIINVVIVGQSILKLLAVLALFLMPFSYRLIVYAFSIMFVSLIGRSFTIYYTEKRYPEAKKDKTKNDKQLSNEIFSFLKYSWFGSLSSIIKNQGPNMLFNIFTGLTTYNASYGVSKHITGVSDMAFGTTSQAFLPQTVKSYSEGNLDKFIRLSMFNGKLAVMLSYIVLIPLFIEIEWVFGIWLEETPMYAVTMTRIIIISEMIRQLYNGVNMTAIVNDKVKQLYLKQTIIQAVAFVAVMVYLLFDRSNIYIILYSDIVVNLIMLVIIMIYNHKNLNIKFVRYLWSLVVPSVSICMLLFVTFCYIFRIESTSFFIHLSFVIALVVCSLLYFYFVLFSQSERENIKSIIKSILQRLCPSKR